MNLSALIALILGFTTSAVMAATVVTATGGDPIASGSASNACNPQWTSLSGPTYRETSRGDLSTGFVFLWAPSGFEFNTSATVSVVLVDGHVQPRRNINQTAEGDAIASTSYSLFDSRRLYVTASFMFFIIYEKDENFRNTFEWQGIQVRPTDRNASAVGNLTASGNSNIADSVSPNNFGTLRQLAVPSRLVVTLPGENFLACQGNTGTPNTQFVDTSFQIARITAADSDFNVVNSYNGSRALSYSGPANGPNGMPVYTSPVNFTNGQSTTPLNTTLRQAETTTISVSDGTISGPPSSPFTVISPAEDFDAFDTSTPMGQTSGVITTKIAGSAFSLDILALSGSSAPATAFSGTVSVELVNAEAAGNCSTWPRILPASTLTFSASDGGRRRISGLNSAEAWRHVRVRMRHPANAPTIETCSSDGFAIRPASLSIAASDADWETPGTTRLLDTASLTGGPVHKAGRAFTLRATARNAANAVTANYNGAPAPALAACTDASCPATLGQLTVGAWTASGGTVSTDQARYSEVGGFNLVLSDEDFAGIDAPDTPLDDRRISSVALRVGRFVPDHFAVASVAITPRSSLPSCTSSAFTYLGEPFDIDFMLSARNVAEQVTTQYHGPLGRLGASDASQLNFAAVDPDGASNLSATISAISAGNPGQVTTAAPHGFQTGDIIFLSGISGMSGVNNTRYQITVISPTVFALGADTSAAGTYLSGGTASRLSVVTATGSWSGGLTNIRVRLVLERGARPDGPFDTLIVGAAPRDPDGVTLQSSALDMETVPGGTKDRMTLGSAMLRYGRLALANAYGSEVLNLPIPLRVQYWNGKGFVTHALDDCTRISASSIGLSNFRQGITASNMGSSNIIVGGDFADGLGRLVLSKPQPRPTDKGSVDVTVDLAAENKTYLRFPWDGGSDGDPRSRAAFGVRGQGGGYYMRELY